MQGCQTDFERTLSSIITEGLEFIQGLVGEIREAEELFHNTVMTTAVSFFERLTKGLIEGAIDIPDELMMVLLDVWVACVRKGSANGLSGDIHLYDDWDHACTCYFL